MHFTRFPLMAKAGELIRETWNQLLRGKRAADCRARHTTPAIAVRGAEFTALK